jgi:hypothetical protein
VSTVGFERIALDDRFMGRDTRLFMPALVREVWSVLEDCWSLVESAAVRLTEVLVASGTK